MNDLIAPSLLAANLLQLGEEVQAVLAAGADAIHFDVMDNHYVPNLTMGSFICQQLTAQFKAILVDVHLMAAPVDALITQFAKAGAKRISIHPDSTIHLDRSLQLIRDAGCSAGLVLNPATSPEWVRWCAPRLDFILVMTVNPGFGGQTLIQHVLEKIQWLHHHFPDIPLCVDGGVNLENIQCLKKAGASQFVVGSALFSQPNYGAFIAQMRTQLGNSGV